MEGSFSDESDNEISSNDTHIENNGILNAHKSSVNDGTEDVYSETYVHQIPGCERMSGNVTADELESPRAIPVVSYDTTRHYVFIDQHVHAADDTETNDDSLYSNDERQGETTPLLQQTMVPVDGCGRDSYNTSAKQNSSSNHSPSGPQDGNKGNRSSARSASESSSSSSSSASTSSGSFSLRTMNREQKLILMNTAIADLLCFLSVSLMAPFFPEEALKKGVSDTLSGWIFGSAPLMQFLLSPVCGRLVPRLGVRLMFLSGLFMSGGCTVLMGSLTYVPVDEGKTVFICLAVLLQTIKSVGSASVSTAGFVLLATWFPDNVSAVFGICEVFVGLGLVTGPAIGGLLYGSGGFLLPFVVIGGLSIVTLPLVFCTLPKPNDHSPTESPSDEKPVSNVLKSTIAIVTSFSIVVSTFAWSILDPTLEPHLRQFELTVEVVGVIFLVMAGVYALSSPIWGWLVDYVPDQRALLIPGFVIAAFGLLLLGPSEIIGFSEHFDELWLVVVSLIILGLAASMSSVPTFDLYITAFQRMGFEDDTRTYGIVAGLWMSMYSLGDFLGPSAGGLLLDNVGFKWMTTITAGICAAMALTLAVTWLIDSRCHRKSVKDADDKLPLLQQENYSATHFTENIACPALHSKGILREVIEFEYAVDEM